MISRTIPEIHEVIKVYEFDPLITDDDTGSSIRFRIEILKKNSSSNQYYAQVYRKETFRVAPTFPQKDGKSPTDGCDEVLVIEDNYEDWQSLSAGHSPEEVLNKVKSKIKKIFNLS